ncbi:hydroxyacylglutathione hydrolase [Rhodanobacter sp. TND4EL1]
MRDREGCVYRSWKFSRSRQLPNAADSLVHLLPLPALTDNYIWLLHDDERNALVVDPGDAAVVESALATHELQLRAILLTHHHPDHIGGMPALRERHQVPVYAPLDDRIEAPVIEVCDGECIELASPAIRFEVMEIPGHTLTHIAFVGAGLLFCGDTLFSLGCGRLFEGSPAQMLESLDRLSRLPAETLVCAGHEYTEANARFARTVEPLNNDLLERRDQVAALREAGRPTLPVALGSELACNPFLRVDADEVIAWARRQGSEENRVGRFTTLRQAKDGFRG